MATAEDKIREIVVIPEIDTSQESTNIVHVLNDCTEYFKNKTEECKQVSLYSYPCTIKIRLIIQLML